MLAQAQACFYEKAVRDRREAPGSGMKPNILAKLAMQASIYYTAAFGHSQKGMILTVLDPSWSGHMDYQAKQFAGAAEYWGAILAKETAAQTGMTSEDDGFRFGNIKKTAIFYTEYTENIEGMEGR